MLHVQRLTSSICVYSRIKSLRLLSSSSTSFLSTHTSITKEKNGLEERIISALVVNRPGTLAQLANVFKCADQSISGLCVRSTIVPELSPSTAIAAIGTNSTKSTSSVSLITDFE
ncbi:unnamed protein product [Peronospora effusa]|nr:unnamed protein product [Peronospora effusa]